MRERYASMRGQQSSAVCPPPPQPRQPPSGRLPLRNVLAEPLVVLHPPPSFFQSRRFRSSRRRVTSLGVLLIAIAMSCTIGGVYAGNNNNWYYKYYGGDNATNATYYDDAYNETDDGAAIASNYSAGGDDDNIWGSGDDYNNYDDDNPFTNNFDYGTKSKNLDFSSISILPTSCIQYKNGHHIKFELYRSDSLSCHFHKLGTFIVSIAHYMRAYFNYQALLKGEDFILPDDAGFLNCQLLEQTAYSNLPLYAKIGCMERSTYTSTKLQLRIYKDKQCSTSYDSVKITGNGYQINGYTIPSRVTFRPPFYSCDKCAPDKTSDTWSKNSNWYDDDAINGRHDDNNGDDDGGDDDTDDDYFRANDDGNVTNDDAAQYYGNRRRNSEISGEIRSLFSPRELSLSKTRKRAWKEYYHEFSLEMRKLSQQSNWNFCDKVWTYGIFCDDECRALDTFREDSWSKSDIFLIVIMCIFLTAMVLLIFAKRAKAYEKASVYGDELDAPYPGLPPVAILVFYVFILTIIIVLAKLKFVNETLVFSVVICILLFIYMLKLTLFESRGPTLLPAANRASIALNAMNRHLFDA